MLGCKLQVASPCRHVLMPLHRLLCAQKINKRFAQNVVNSGYMLAVLRLDLAWERNG